MQYFLTHLCLPSYWLGNNYIWLVNNPYRNECVCTKAACVYNRYFSLGQVLSLLLIWIKTLWAVTVGNIIRGCYRLKEASTFWILSSFHSRFGQSSKQRRWHFIPCKSPDWFLGFSACWGLLAQPFCLSGEYQLLLAATLLSLKGSGKGSGWTVFDKPRSHCSASSIILCWLSHPS